MMADDTTCFVDGSQNLFDNLFSTLDTFAEYSGCKINLSKSEAIWIGSKKGSNTFPLREKGLSWKLLLLKLLVLYFILNTKYMFDLNYKVKLKQIEQSLNCWRARNLSLIGKICVTNLFYCPNFCINFLFCVSKSPNHFLMLLINYFFKFIWNGGNERVKRKTMCLDYSDGGLKMIDIRKFALAQRMVLDSPAS